MEPNILYFIFRAILNRIPDGLRNCVNKEYFTSAASSSVYPGAPPSGAGAGGPGNSEPVSLLPNGASYYQGGAGIPPVQQAHSTTAHDPPHSVSVTQGIPLNVASVAGLPPGLPQGLARLPSSPATASAAMAAVAAQQKDVAD